MKKKCWLVLLLLLVTSFSSLALAEEKKEGPGRDETFDTTSEEVKKKYVNVLTAIYATLIKPDLFPGPSTGPGFYMGRNGPLISIDWFKKIEANEVVTLTKRYIPIGSILSVDQLFPDSKSTSSRDRYVVYYKGPFGETEFFILVDDEMENGKGSIYESFIERWKLYLLGQER